MVFLVLKTIAFILTDVVRHDALGIVSGLLTYSLFFADCLMHLQEIIVYSTYSIRQ